MIAIKNILISNRNIFTELVCSCCHKHLGYRNTINGKEYNETKGWKYCPYCGKELDK